MLTRLESFVMKAKNHNACLHQRLHPGVVLVHAIFRHDPDPGIAKEPYLSRRVSATLMRTVGSKVTMRHTTCSRHSPVPAPSPVFVRLTKEGTQIDCTQVKPMDAPYQPIDAPYRVQRMGTLV